MIGVVLLKLFDLFQAVNNEDRAKRLENELLSYQGDHNHSDQEVSYFHVPLKF